MPVKKVKQAGKECYKWGNSGKVYCGRGGKTKAARQGRAVAASKYSGKR